MKRRFVGSLVLALATSTVVAGLAAAPAGATASWGCGRLVTGSITLSSDMIDCPGDGFVIGAANITINLNGHLLSGVGTGKGINNRDGFDGVTVTNGRIENFETGAYFINSSYSTISKITFTDLNGVLLSGAQSAEQNRIEQNIFYGNRSASGTGVWVDGLATRLAYNSLRAFTQYGIYVGDAGDSVDISRNTVTSGGYGIYTYGRWTNLSLNTASWNRYGGIVVGSRRCLYGASTCAFPTGDLGGNIAEHNGGDGISLGNPSAALHGNQSNYNASMGIRGWPGIDDEGANRATGNGSTPQCTYVVCS